MELDLATVKPSVVNAIVITLIILITIPLLRWALNAYPVPGLTQLINAV